MAREEGLAEGNAEGRHYFQHRVLLVIVLLVVVPVMLGWGLPCNLSKALGHGTSLSKEEGEEVRLDSETAASICCVVRGKGWDEASLATA
jgi:hypothetical protein